MQSALGRVPSVRCSTVRKPQNWPKPFDWAEYERLRKQAEEDAARLLAELSKRRTEADKEGEMSAETNERAEGLRERLEELRRHL